MKIWSSICVACMAAGLWSAPQSSVVAPRPTPSRFTTFQYGITVSMPPGLYYCPIPGDWSGADHGRSFYLMPPTQCDVTAAYVLGPADDETPRLDLYYAYNVAGARTPAELARLDCARPRPIAGVTLLGRPAIGCEVTRGDWVDVSASTPYDLEPRTKGYGPDARLTVQLTTRRTRLASDRSVFAAFAAGVHQCAAEWRDQDGKTMWVGVAPGRPECPASVTW
jgi:hypothetical protein